MDKEKIKYIRNIFTSQITSLESSYNGVYPEIIVNFSNNSQICCYNFSANSLSHITSICFGDANTIYIDDYEITYCFTDGKYIYAVYESDSPEGYKITGHIKIKLNE